MVEALEWLEKAVGPPRRHAVTRIANGDFDLVAIFSWQRMVSFRFARIPHCGQAVANQIQDDLPDLYPVGPDGRQSGVDAKHDLRPGPARRVERQLDALPDDLGQFAPLP